MIAKFLKLKAYRDDKPNTINIDLYVKPLENAILKIKSPEDWQNVTKVFRGFPEIIKEKLADVVEESLRQYSIDRINGNKSETDMEKILINTLIRLDDKDGQYQQKDDKIIIKYIEKKFLNIEDSLDMSYINYLSGLIHDNQQKQYFKNLSEIFIFNMSGYDKSKFTQVAVGMIKVMPRPLTELEKKSIEKIKTSNYKNLKPRIMSNILGRVKN